MKNAGAQIAMDFSKNKGLAPMAIEKIKILGAVLELPAKQYCQFSSFGPIFEVNGLDQQCYLAGSSKKAPRILIFSMAIGANYSYEVKISEIWAPAFFKHNNSFIATVIEYSPLSKPLKFTYYTFQLRSINCHLFRQHTESIFNVIYFWTCYTYSILVSL